MVNIDQQTNFQSAKISRQCPVFGNLSRTRLIDEVPHARLSCRTNRPPA
ncbi:MAG TPA: hypothetical protein VJ323_13140 [Bryobacteraceae bacterium]|nr:hypothetical protein [Bryobacteraceae bacterium]